MLLTVHRATAQNKTLLKGRLSQAAISRFISAAITLQRNITKDLRAYPLAKIRVRMLVIQHTLAWDNRIALRYGETAPMTEAKENLIHVTSFSG